MKVTGKARLDREVDRVDTGAAPGTSRDVLIIGQGLAGSALAWTAMIAGKTVLVADASAESTASRVAAGLITPVTGQRMVVAADFAARLEAAERFYRRVEEETGRSLLRSQPARRLFRSDAEQQLYQSLSGTTLRAETSPFTDGTGRVIGFDMPRAMRLDVAGYLEATRQELIRRGSWLQAAIEADDVQPEPGRVHLRRHNTCADRLVFCTGWTAKRNPWFPDIPDGPSRGEILRIRLPGYRREHVLHRGVWLAPQPGTNDEFLLGATYDRENLFSGPTKAGRDELLAGLASLTSTVPEVLGHYSAVRAGQRNRKPVARVHAEQPRLAIVNGLGSRGALLAPGLAAQLFDRWFSDVASGEQPESEKRSSRRPSLTKLVHTMLSRTLRPGDRVIDATAGNGNDTLHLARCVGPAGEVIAIDIQPEAIRATGRRLEQSRSELAGVRLVQGDHAVELLKLQDAGAAVKAVVFNLGYLPGSSREIVTTAASTIVAVKAARDMLLPGGLLTVVAYRGHPGGQAEAEALERELFKGTSGRSDDTIERIESDAARPDTPVLFVLRRGRR